MILFLELNRSKLVPKPHCRNTPPFNMVQNWDGGEPRDNAINHTDPAEINRDKLNIGLRET